MPAKSEIVSLKKYLKKRFDQEGLVPCHGWYCLNNSLKDSDNHNQNKPLPKDVQEKQEIQRNIISGVKRWQPKYWENAQLNSPKQPPVGFCT